MALTAKVMEIRLKNNWTTDNFLQQYSFSEEEFQAELHRIYTSTKSFNSIMDRIRRNDKRARKIGSSLFGKQQKLVFINTKLASNKAIAEGVEDKEDTITLKNIDQLLEKKKAELTSIERLHDASSSKVTELRDKILDYEREEKTIMNRLKHIHKALEEIRSDHEAEATNLDKLGAKVSKCLEELKVLDDKKLELTRIYVLVNDDGSIEISDEKVADSEIPEEWEELHKSLYGNELLDSLTGAQIKQLAKLLVYTEKLENYEVIFNSEEMEEAYKKLKS